MRETLSKMIASPDFTEFNEFIKFLAPLKFRACKSFLDNYSVRKKLDNISDLTLNILLLSAYAAISVGFAHN